MILVDTSVWVAHLRAAETQLGRLLESGLVLIHPFVIGELALGNIRNREAVLGALTGLPQVNKATDPEALRFIDHHGMAGRGIGYIDVHLLAATRLTPGAELWSIDRRLQDVAAELGLAFGLRRA